MDKYKVFNVWNALVKISMYLMYLMRKQSNANYLEIANKM
jgi:hypothetical protein